MSKREATYWQMVISGAALGAEVAMCLGAVHAGDKVGTVAFGAVAGILYANFSILSRAAAPPTEQETIRG